MTQPDIEPIKFNKVLCIGLGISGICLGAQLQEKYGFNDMHFYDRNESHSGTWWSNHYPGAACDIPAVFYSFSFAQHRGWSRFLPQYGEIRQYLENVVDKYQLRPFMTFNTECNDARWDAERKVWIVTLTNVKTGEVSIHECRILFSAVGLLVDPITPTISGIETFKGPVFHTARWRDDVDLRGKNVAVIGNGCTAAQLVPNLVSRTKTVTQFARSPQWLIHINNIVWPPVILWMLRHIPLLNRLFRFIVWAVVEMDWRIYVLDCFGHFFRKLSEAKSKRYIQRAAPKKYHKVLIPDFKMGCKRRIFDTNGDYLKALHNPSVDLTYDPITQITPEGIKTAQKLYPTDVIVLATGFHTNNNLGSIKIQGENGVWLHEHWNKQGGMGAYDSIAVAGFPNFFMLYGPNSGTGHTSVVFVLENAVQLALKISAPVLNGEATEVAIKDESYTDYVASVQAVSKTRVFTECTNLYNTKSGWNGVVYPWSQLRAVRRVLFPTWKDWKYKYTALHQSRVNRFRVLQILLLFLVFYAMRNRDKLLELWRNISRKKFGVIGKIASLFI